MTQQRHLGWPASTTCDNQSKIYDVWKNSLELSEDVWKENSMKH